MLRPSQSRRRTERGARHGRGLRGLVLATALLAGVAAPVCALAEEEGCTPFEERYSQPLQIASAELGVEPAGAPAGSSAGAIVKLPAPPSRRPEAPSGEALLALPKGSDGALPTDFELGTDARIADSFFSPILCSTIARIVGPVGATLEGLVEVVPESATVVPNAMYVTAADEITPLDAATAAPEVRPDPYRSLQYGLDQLGVEAAAFRSRGEGVKIAVLDSASASDHHDLAAVDVVPIPGGPPLAAAVHGTLMAGVVGATTDNGFGMAGIAPDADVLSVPICTPAGATATDECLLFDLLRGLDVAWGRESQVLNLSIVGPSNALLGRAMSRLDELGVLIVAAAGNEATLDPRYPAAYPSVIGVGAVDRERRPTPRTNRGPSAELMAPGSEVLSAVPGGAFAFGSGTSFAAAHVSGALAVLLGSGVEPAAARAALFREAHEAERSDAGVLLPPLCDVLARLGLPCRTP